MESCQILDLHFENGILTVSFQNNITKKRVSPLLHIYTVLVVKLILEPNIMLIFNIYWLQQML